MARIAGVDLPNDKRVEYALPYIFGIGLTLSREKLAAIAAEDIAPVCPFAARTPKTTPVPARVPKRARARSNQ